MPIPTQISIIIPTYNCEKIIGRTLDCIASQTFTEWECIVVDDFSSDNTRRLIEEYEQKDGRFHYMLNERKKGAQGARNTGIYHACSEWIWLMDSDDTVHVDFLEKMYGATNADVDVVTCYTNVIDKDSMLVPNTRKWDVLPEGMVVIVFIGENTGEASSDIVNNEEVSENFIANPHANPHEKLDILDMKILSAIKDNSKITHDELSKITGKHKDTIRVHLKSLREKGFIARIGPDKGGYWKVVEQKEE